MEHYDIKRLALVLAVQAEIEGMKAENAQRQQLDQPLTYTNEDFISKGCALENLAYAHAEQL